MKRSVSIQHTGDTLRDGRNARENAHGRNDEWNSAYGITPPTSLRRGGSFGRSQGGAEQLPSRGLVKAASLGRSQNMFKSGGSSGAASFRFNRRPSADSAGSGGDGFANRTSAAKAGLRPRPSDSTSKNSADGFSSKPSRRVHQNPNSPPHPHMTMISPEQVKMLTSQQQSGGSSFEDSMPPLVSAGRNIATNQNAATGLMPSGPSSHSGLRSKSAVNRQRPQFPLPSSSDVDTFGHSSESMIPSRWSKSGGGMLKAAMEAAASLQELEDDDESRSSSGSRAAAAELRKKYKNAAAKSMTQSMPQTMNQPRSKPRYRMDRMMGIDKIFDDPAVVIGYASVPLLEVDRLPRGGISIETKAVGRVQFGIPPETIKDSMRLGIGVPAVYIVPPERFCREMGPALGINLAEFEFPAYFNFFVRNKPITLVVDSHDAESNIRRVFGETLLGPAQFRDHDKPKANEEEDFDPSFPPAARPNFYKEFYNFRTSEECTNYEELRIDMLLSFQHFTSKESTSARDVQHTGNTNRDKMGVPPPPPNTFADMDGMEVPCNRDEPEKGETERSAKVQRPKLARSQTADTAQNDSGLDRRIPPVNYRDRRSGSSIHIPSSFADDLGSDSDDDDGSESDWMENEHGENGESRGLRRTVSDPDMSLMQMNSIRSLTTAENDPTAFMDQQQSYVPTRRGSIESHTTVGTGTLRDRDGMSWVSGTSFILDSDDDEEKKSSSWMYSQVKWLGEVCTVYPPSATEKDKESLMTARIEIFKMPGGTEYILHDIDENNHIIGKARFSGTVRVPDEMAVEGFLTEQDDAEEGNHADDDNDGEEATEGIQINIPRSVVPPTFHPPSFGVTVLGNSHGFDKNGSVSGYVLWINGRGVMIDPPPYSSATLEREGIRPRMIMAIIITHCHADHDAGAFQKVMTGSRVAVITTPTIYKSFIRKYAALSGLSPVLLRHSHRHRPAIVGQPLKFQGATFHFTYTLHTIPCIAFKVEWRGRSMVFTGDHMNIPEKIDELQEKGVFTKERADDIRNLPLQDCDLLLHESGAPPIHTPLEVLLKLPEHVKKRLYVVHTSALPKECELRVAPTGTAGTIRLDQLNPNVDLRNGNNVTVENSILSAESTTKNTSVSQNEKGNTSTSKNGTIANGNNAVSTTNSKPIYDRAPDQTGTTPETAQNLNQVDNAAKVPISSLDDGGNMCLGQVGDHFVPVPAHFFEQDNVDSKDGTGSKGVPPLVRLRPTCVSDAWFILNLLSAVPFLSSLSYANTMEVLELAQVEVVCANEVVLQAHRRNDFLCVVWEGTCIEGGANENISGSGDMLSPSVWHAGDWSGPISLQPECSLSGSCTHRGPVKDMVAVSAEGVKVIIVKMKELHKILKSGSALYRKYLEIIERQHHEEDSLKHDSLSNLSLLSLHGDKDSDRPLSRSLNSGHSVDNLLEVISYNSALRKLTALQKRHLESLAEGPKYFEAGQLIWHVGAQVEYSFLVMSGTAIFAQPPKRRRFVSRRGSTGSITSCEPHSLSRLGASCDSHVTQDKILYVSPNSEYARLEVGLQLRVEEMETEIYQHPKGSEEREERMRNARDRFANKVLSRLYARNAYTPGLVFSRGHFLSDTSRMVSGSLAFIEGKDTQANMDETHHGTNNEHHFHSSNISAGPDGCVAMVFPRASLISFLDAYPGVLLSLLGTQIVV